MQLLKKVLNFYIESSIHVALAVYALIRITFLKLGLPYDEPVAYFGFYGTIVGYNFVKYDELARVKKVTLTLTFKAIIGLSFFATIASGYYFLQLKPLTQAIGVVALGLTALYTLPFLPHKKNMRNWSGVKIYLVALSWMVVTVLLPVLNAGYDFDLIVVLKCVQRFILVFVLLLVFEIIDLQFDAHSLKTIPQRIGENQTKNLGYGLIFAFLLLECLKPNITIKQFGITLLVALILGLFAFFASSKQSKYYTSFWVESVPLLWLFLLLLKF